MAVTTSPAASDSRPRFAVAPPYRVGTLTINPRSREVRVAGTLVTLSAKEYELLCVLAGDPTRVFTRQELYQIVWGIVSHLPTRTLDSHAHRLRKKLAVNGDRFIYNVWGVGYRLTDVAMHIETTPATEPVASRRYLITDRSDYLVEAASKEEAREVYLARGGAFVSLSELLVEEAG